MSCEQTVGRAEVVVLCVIFKLAFLQYFITEQNMPKNITNGQFVIAYDQNDRVDASFKFMRCPNNQSLQFLKHEPQKTVNHYYIQNIRTGQFTQVSENYMLESTQQKQDQQRFTTNSFETEMRNLFEGLQEKMNRLTTWFQGLFAGMALLYTITLNLSTSVSADLVRVEDQALRVMAILSSFGAMYSLLIAHQKYTHIKTRGTSGQIDRHYKSFMLCLIEMIFYTISYIIYNVSHTYAVQYNISSLSPGATVVGYSQLSQITTVYTVFVIIGWIFTNVNTYKYET